MKRLAIAAALLALPSQTSAQEVYATKCKGSPANCLQEARDTCRGRYRALSSGSHAGGLIADAIPGPITWYVMSYVCGASGPPPAFAYTARQYVAPAQRMPTTTTCNRIGNQVYCQSY